VAYTQDDPKQVLFRLAVFFCIIQAAWEECSHIKGVGPLEFMRTSKFCFVGDDGTIKSEITSNDLVNFMTAEKILVTNNRTWRRRTRTFDVGSVTFGHDLERSCGGRQESLQSRRS
jgi:hypothetical protein